MTRPGDGIDDLLLSVQKSHPPVVACYPSIAASETSSPGATEDRMTSVCTSIASSP